jgi:hypothetical protein
MNLKKGLDLKDVGWIFPFQGTDLWWHFVERQWTAVFDKIQGKP